MIVYFKEYDKLYSFLEDVEKFTCYQWFSSKALPTQAVRTLRYMQKCFDLGSAVFLHFDSKSRTIACGSESITVTASDISINHKFFEGARK